MAEAITIAAVIDANPAKAGAEVYNRAVASMRDATGAAASKMDQLTGATGLLKGALGALAAAFAIKGIVDAADQITLLKVRMEGVTGSAAAGAEALGKLKAVARDSRTSTTDLAAAYGVMHGQLKDAKLSQDEAIGSLGLLSKSMQLGGASAEQINGAMSDLSRAFTAGRFEGRAFIGLMESAPILMQKLQEMTGLSAKQLRAWALDGKISGATVVSVLNAAQSDIDSKFATMPRTMGGAFTQVADSLKKTLGEAFSSGEGGSRKFIEAMDALRDAFKSEDFKSAIKFVADVIGTIATAAVAAATALKELRDFAKSTAPKSDVGAAMGYAEDYRNLGATQNGLAGVAGFADRMRGLSGTRAANIGAFQTTTEAAKAAGPLKFEEGQQEKEIRKAIELERLQVDLARAKALDQKDEVARIEEEVAVRSRVTDEMRKNYGGLAAQYEAQIRVTEAAKRQADIMAQNRQVAGEFFQAFTDGALNGAKQGLKFSDTLRQMTATLIELIAKFTILNPLKRQFEQSGSAALSGLGFNPEQGLLGGLFGGSSSSTAGNAANGGWSTTTSSSGGLASLLGFATGGEFNVGGSGGTDSQLVAFRASPDETVSIRRPDQMGGSNSSGPNMVNVHFNVSGDATDATLMKMRQMADEVFTQRSPQVVNASVDAVKDRNVRDRNYLRR